ncbi:hypothetical protein [Desulfohalovibrio reitneri]|uniref:hypothetical protein n=1 Tax=Desulfohalovibrio reitneri TaxID=1307759 RepID=UPI0004A743AA|nr:hypothetical protein [Desulfohalovibrio reitneri]
MAAPSQVELCNLALTSLGVGPVGSLEESSRAARLCRLHYHTARREVLEAHHWSFATARAVLARLDTAPRFGFARAYALPSDCLAARRLEPEAPFEPTSLGLETDASPARLVYTLDVTDPARFPALFRRALAAYLASLLASPLTHSAELEAQARGRYEALLEAARESDAAEGLHRPRDDNPWLEARW